ncbi:hypothetical protein BDV93DRAFT_512902 [Ceratobasidium sp. AG-I]|nr:hypothetical protein BDV93DRAFT_512902 [Ceratobasidium sp. AG-I]
MAAIYTPPELPSYLLHAFELKPVVGIASDDEVKMIHAVIRAVENVSKGRTTRIRRLLYLHTSKSRSQRSQNLANVPSMFNPDLSMSLSQHLFNVHFARHIQHSTEGHYLASQDAPPQVKIEPGMESLERPMITSELPMDPADSVLEVVSLKSEIEFLKSAVISPTSEHEITPGFHDSHPISSDILHENATLSEDARSIIEQLKANVDHSGRGLAGLQDTLAGGLKDVTRLMIKLYNHSARGFNSGYGYEYHHIVTKARDAPTMYEVPDRSYQNGARAWSNMSNVLIAQYLHGTFM